VPGRLPPCRAAFAGSRARAVRALRRRSHADLRARHPRLPQALHRLPPVRGSPSVPSGTKSTTELLLLVHSTYWIAAGIRARESMARELDRKEKRTERTASREWEWLSTRSSSSTTR
jgi:hypothetical protein